MNFSAVILAGGKSSRMGRDKAFLEINGQPLLVRQISLAQEAGASQIIISGRAGTDYSAFNCQVLVDQSPDLGPLSGIDAALQTVTDPLLLVLAVDMPYLTADFLKKLRTHCSRGAGAVPSSDEIIEPLAAFYPKSAAGLIPQLRANSLQPASPGGKDFAKLCVKAGLVHLLPLLPGETGLFKSLNSPADLRR
jgi:molybdopterin-guanine dinucleotide biosynthesis protein A